MRRYQHRPISVDAQQFKGGVTDASLVLKWVNTNGGKGVWCGAITPHTNADGRVKHPGLPETLRIRTRKGWELIQVGDYVVRNERGEFSPVEKDVFELNYESALAEVIDITPQTKPDWGPKLRPHG